MDELPVIDEGSIVVGIDGSDHSRRAVRWALDEARLRDLPLVAVMAWQFPLKGVDVTADEPVDGHELTRGRLQDFLHETLGDDLDDRVRAEPAFGSPGKVLATLSETATLLVVGRRGQSRLAALTLGSAADHVAKHATCPVVIVH
jgi:nucleotide-binding universal stress UspA family protein